MKVTVLSILINLFGLSSPALAASSVFNTNLAYNLEQSGEPDLFALDQQWLKELNADLDTMKLSYGLDQESFANFQSDLTTTKNALEGKLSKSNTLPSATRVAYTANTRVTNPFNEYYVPEPWGTTNCFSFQAGCGNYNYELYNPNSWHNQVINSPGAMQ